MHVITIEELKGDVKFLSGILEKTRKYLRSAEEKAEGYLSQVKPEHVNTLKHTFETCFVEIRLKIREQKEVLNSCQRHLEELKNEI